MATSLPGRQLTGVALASLAAFALLTGGALAQSPPPGVSPPYSGIFPGTGLTTLPGMNGAQSQMASSIDDVCPTINNIAATSDQHDLANVCSVMTGTALTALGQANPLGLQSLNLTTDQLKTALQSIDGGASIITPTSQTGRLRNGQIGMVGQRLDVLRMRMMSGIDPDSQQARQFAMNTGPSVTDASGAIQIAQTAPTTTSMWSGKLGAFVNLLGQFGTADQTGTQNGYDFNNEGFLAGFDYQFTPKLVAGFAFGYTSSNTDFTSAGLQGGAGSFLDGNLFQGNLYANYYWTDNFYLSGIASIGGGDNISQRNIVIPGFTNRTANGDFGSMTYGVSLGGGYNFPIGALTITPNGRVEYHRVSASGFTENGAQGLDLTYGSTGQNTILSFLGVQGSYAISTSWGVISPTGRLEWAHQYNNGSSTVSVAYSNDPSLLSAFTLPGDRNTSDYGDIGVGVSLQFAGNLSAFVNYDALVGLNHTSYNSFTAGMRFGF
jgi:outer membrane autotransporter protein